MNNVNFVKISIGMKYFQIVVFSEIASISIYFQFLHCEPSYSNLAEFYSLSYFETRSRTHTRRICVDGHITSSRAGEYESDNIKIGGVT